jgi:polyhydroxyalkanoate synthesis regulator phasin
MRPSTLNKKLVAAGLSAGLLAGGAAGAILTSGGVSGAAVAQDDTTTTVAGGSDEQPRQGRMNEFLTETLSPLVEDGSITQEQMLEVIAAIEAARPAGGAGGSGGHGQGHGHRGQGLEAAAEALGMDQAELRDQLRDGASLAEIAQAQGVDVQVVIDALVAEAKAHLDEKVAEGDLTQEEADERLAELTERITERVDGGGGRGDQQED